MVPPLKILLTLGSTPVALTAVASSAPRTRRRGPGDAPVRKELDAFREKSSKNAPPERLRIYEQGIEEVRKSGVTDKALKVGDRLPTSSSRTPPARRSSFRSCSRGARSS